MQKRYAAVISQDGTNFRRVMNTLKGYRLTHAPRIGSMDSLLQGDPSVVICLNAGGIDDEKYKVARERGACVVSLYPAEPRQAREGEGFIRLPEIESKLKTLVDHLVSS